MTSIQFHEIDIYAKIRQRIDSAKEGKNRKLSDMEIKELLEWAKGVISPDYSFIVAKNPHYYFDPETGKSNDPIHVRRKRKRLS